MVADLPGPYFSLACSRRGTLSDLFDYISPVDFMISWSI
jgi:hypothetical protein